MLNSNFDIKLPPRFQDVDYKRMSGEIISVIKNIKKERKGLYIYGDCGTGKTYIAYSILMYFSKIDLFKARFYTSTEILDKLKEDYSENSKRNFNEINEYTGILIIDDIGSEKVTDWVLETYYKIINHRYEKKLPVIFTSNLSLADLSEVYGDRIPSRITEMCKIVELVGKDKRLKNVKKVQMPYID